MGARRPLGMGAASLSLFAFSPDEEVEEILHVNERRIREYSGMTGADMRRLIAMCRQRGYTLTEGVVEKGVTGIGAPIFGNDGGVCGAISVTAISEKIDKEQYDGIAALIKNEVALTVWPGGVR